MNYLEIIICFLLTLSSIIITMELVFKEAFSCLPKPFIKTFNRTLNNALESKSRVVSFVLCVCTRIIFIQACGNSLVYTNFVWLVDQLIGKWIRKLHIIPFVTHLQTNVQEDPGVVEMRALLNGEDCFDHDLHQSQMRPVFPPDFNPYAEFLLVSFHLKLSNLIVRLHSSLKRHRGPSNRIINRFASWFDDSLLKYFASNVVVNKRN